MPLAADPVHLAAGSLGAAGRTPSASHSYRTIVLLACIHRLAPPPPPRYVSVSLYRVDPPPPRSRARVLSLSLSSRFASPRAAASARCAQAGRRPAVTSLSPLSLSQGGLHSGRSRRTAVTPTTCSSSNETATQQSSRSYHLCATSSFTMWSSLRGLHGRSDRFACPRTRWLSLSRSHRPSHPTVTPYGVVQCAYTRYNWGAQHLLLNCVSYFNGNMISEYGSQPFVSLHRDFFRSQLKPWQ